MTGLHRVSVAVVLLTALIACGGSDGSEYLGRWELTLPTGTVCTLDVSKLGANFFVKDLSTGYATGPSGRCGLHEGVLTRTPQGTLTTQSGVDFPQLWTFDKSKNQIVVSGLEDLEYLRKIP